MRVEEKGRREHENGRVRGEFDQPDDDPSEKAGKWPERSSIIFECDIFG
jgi:hypothetical protein